ncbi:hypothetical protein E3N88_23893 [Mikania micrantha]|uniref:Uncharacterized protein n=1 Tax=Mikania micrantha TaxID=192012 RepID=A0A5N6NEL9_9ASTR|nr:hypothetical protein E3N88_23893 [Mikania micrantha]
MFDAIDDVMAEHNTNDYDVDEYEGGLDPEFDALFMELNTELYPTSKKKLRKIGLGYQSIHACHNDCVLFWKENALMQNCPISNESRWVDKNTKGKKVPQKVRSTDGMMRHPIDGKAWQEFHKKYPNFAKEPRNVQFGLAANGFNPFVNMSQTYSMWPVVLTTYNTPPWLCMKESSFMLTLLIPGPKSLGKDIDVFLRPLVDELKTLWIDGVQMRDASTKTVFTMRASLLWTINDYPARSSLSGWSGQGWPSWLGGASYCTGIHAHKSWFL